MSISVYIRWFWGAAIWGLFCLVAGPIIYIAWRQDREGLTKTMANKVYLTALRAHREKIEEFKEHVSGLQEKLDVIGLELRNIELVGGPELIMPPEGEILNTFEGSWIFWFSDEMKEEILKTATDMFRHRVRHYSKGNLSTLIPQK
jgi:hypothetical protein